MVSDRDIRPFRVEPVGSPIAIIAGRGGLCHHEALRFRMDPAAVASHASSAHSAHMPPFTVLTEFLLRPRPPRAILVEAARVGPQQQHRDGTCANAEPTARRRRPRGVGPRVARRDRRCADRPSGSRSECGVGCGSVPCKGSSRARQAEGVCRYERVWRGKRGWAGTGFAGSGGQNRSGRLIAQRLRKARREGWSKGHEKRSCGVEILKTKVAFLCVLGWCGMGARPSMAHIGKQPSS